MFEAYLNPDAVIGHSITKEKLLTKLTGAHTVNSLTNLSVDYRETHAIIQNSEILSFEEQPEEGYPIEIYIDHQVTGEFEEFDNIIVTLPNSGVYVCVCPDTITILEGEYARITARTFNGKTYIDAQTFYYIDTHSIPMPNVGDVYENVLLRYNGWILGMNSSHRTTSTTEIGEAILNDTYRFTISCTESGKIIIQSQLNPSYYLDKDAAWSTTSNGWFFDGQHIGASNKTDGSDRLYMSSPTTLVKGKNSGAVWIVTQSKKTAK